ncbi:hypothetical protein [Acetobacter sicerae]|uniref:hypothetical protein n=1 Tax=Acetobacter sicerae TaxID=85325 RepID=UPI0018E9E0C5|nr:hypothetical protein [Acetobacter sicerae]
MSWPQRGVYFFQEQGEYRRDGGARIVRVGTHALTDTSRTKLWGRLSQHRGRASVAGGNHRGSIFRLLVGTAFLERRGVQSATWGLGSNAPAYIRAQETDLEGEVSNIIGAMPLLWLDIDGSPDSRYLRGYVERNTIALLSNYGKEAIDPPSPQWLGHGCNRERVRSSGLWNNNHVDESYDPAFLDRLSELVDAMKVK